MSEDKSANNPGNPGSADKAGKTNTSNVDAEIREQNLERMEALIRQSALGIHVLFENEDIAKVMRKPQDEKDFFDFEKMKRVQEVITQLIAKKTYFEKVSFLRELDEESYDMLIRTYFHIVENNVKAQHELSH